MCDCMEKDFLKKESRCRARSATTLWQLLEKKKQRIVTERAVAERIKIMLRTEAISLHDT